MKVQLNNLFKNKERVNRRRNINSIVASKDEVQEIKFDKDKVRRRKVERKTNNINLSNFKEGLKNILLNRNNFSKGTYALLISMFFLAILSVTFTVRSYNLFKEEDYDTFVSEDNVQAISTNYVSADKNIEQDSIANNKDVQEKSEESKTTNVNENVEATNNTYVRETLDFKSPIQGEILKIYSADKVIYSKTLDMWKTHDGIDIEGKMGEAVYASERGTVEKIFNDSFLGMTVVISHIAGYKTSYSNLSENIPVVVGQQVKKSQRIGNISDTSIGEIKDSPHLHFMVFKNNETIDPTSVLD